MNQPYSVCSKLPELTWPFVRMTACSGLMAMTILDATAQAVAPSYAPVTSGTAMVATDLSAALAVARAEWDAGSADATAAERLIGLLKSNGQASQAIVVGEQAYQRFENARWLILSMDIALGASMPQELRRLLAVARVNEARFSNLETYWLFAAYLDGLDQNRSVARSAYARALAINPSSVSARSQILWFEIDGNELESLARHLEQWKRDAESVPAFWTPYAVGLVKVNKPDESIAWYERQIRVKPDDILWQVSYVYVLSEAGRPSEAQKLRRGILQRLKNNPEAGGRLSAPDRRSLMLAHATMARDFESEPAANRVLQEMMTRGYRDVDVYSQLVASSIAMDDTVGASRWLSKAASEGIALPAYQVLGVAFARNDRRLIAEVLEKRGQELTVADRVAALRRLDRSVEALALVDMSLAGSTGETGKQLLQQRYEILSDRARRAEVRHERRNIGELEIARTEIAASVHAPWGRTGVRIARNALRSETGSPNLNLALDETDLSVTTDVAVAGDPVKVTLGTNQRSDVSFAYGSAEWIHPLSKDFRARIEGVVNTLTEESSAMRAVGKKDKLSFGISGNPSPMTNARFELAGQRFHTRKGEALGRGLHVEGEVGATLIQGSPFWQVRVSGGADHNHLAENLPPGLAGTVLSTFSTVESLIPKRFSTLGTGSTLRFGKSDGPERGSNGFVDIWVGRQWPAKEIAYSLRASVALPVRTGGEFRLEAYYSNVQNGVSGTGKSNQGVTAGYRHEF